MSYPKRRVLSDSKTDSTATGTNTITVNVPDGEIWLLKSIVTTRGANMTLDKVEVDGVDINLSTDSIDMESHFGELSYAMDSVVLTVTNSGGIGRRQYRFNKRNPKIRIIMKYECQHNGSTRYNGERIRYIKGENDVPDGALDHVGSCKMVINSTKTVVESSDKRDKPLDGTKKEIKQWLDDNDVEYDANALKDELLERLESV